MGVDLAEKLRVVPTLRDERLVAEAPVRLTVMDLMGARSFETVRLDPAPSATATNSPPSTVSRSSPTVGTASATGLLPGAHFGIAPFRPGCLWLMSVVDCQGMGLSVIIPRTGGLAEHIDEEPPRQRRRGRALHRRLSRVLGSAIKRLRGVRGMRRVYAEGPRSFRRATQSGCPVRKR
ncbi:hypothetical protein [Streptomyces aureoversilis]|uniref:Uncharacterized protein n=1 Tax=Streptomyces aureoversilis TaxID=67277 RepID=A0ABW0AB91_9ACTN